MSDKGLNILVRSFSYKKRSLEDSSGHGIGFVFDMRGIDNPGRIESMKILTGKDEEVRNYLEMETNMPEFISHIKGLLDITVINYMQRNFTDLTVNFGCTGGQHRSVYAAETIAAYLNEKFPVQVTLQHLEQESWIR